MKKNIISIVFSSIILVACGGSDTSVDNVEVTSGPVPNEFVGTYNGTISGRASAELLPVSESFEEDITIIVREDNTITFAGDDPDEVFTTNIGSNGGFNGSLFIDEDDCEGQINVSGTVDGSVAQGEIGGEGECDGVDVDLTGTFNATQ